MGERLTDDELRAAAARRPGYATYPEYRAQPERLGRLPRVAGHPSTGTIRAATAPMVPTDPAPASTPRHQPDRPHYLLRIGQKVSEEDAEALKQRITTALADRNLKVAVLPPPPVIEFFPKRSPVRPWWLPRWNWAVMSGGGSAWSGYCWTEAGARRRTARAAREAARCSA